MKLNHIAAALSMSSFFCIPVFAQSVSGIVKNSAGQPVKNVKIAVGKSKQKVFTDENGRFELSNLSEGTFELHVTKSAYSHQNKTITVGQTDIMDLSLTLVSSSIEVIDVHATPLHSSNIESALPVNVIASDELRLKQASTLGETLKNEVGVHSSYYGPVSSSPIIRGLDGPRVLITQNGLDVGDASRVGPDHVVSSETATAQQIEVLRGPATLFYGSGAIGGVVNVVDNRVPNTLERSVNYMAKHNDVADENEVSVAADSYSGQLAFHVDAFWRDGNNYDIPGFAESVQAHDEHEEDHEEMHEGELDGHDDHEEEQGAKGILLNSAAKASGFTIGSSYILENGFVGFAYGQMSRTYGIPGHSHADEHEEHDEHEEQDEHAEESVEGDLTQDRIQLLSELNFDQSFINKVASKASYTDYQHQEIENGAVGTQFNNEMLEMRFDIHHKEYQGWKGAWTLHYKTSDFEAIGEEAFTPPSKTKSVALAWLEEKHFEQLLIQLGARIEKVELETQLTEEADIHSHESEALSHFSAEAFTPVSISAGVVWDYRAGYNLGISSSFSQRAPSATELFSNGPHIGTNTYELGAMYHVHGSGDDLHFDIGDSQVDLETAMNVDLTWRKFEGDLGFVISAFYNHIDDYYYQANTGEFSHAEHEEDEHEAHDEHEESVEEQGLPVYQYQQNDVKMYGLEAELVYQWGNGVSSTLFGDVIRAKLDDGSYLPRIPPMRIGGQLAYQGDSFGMQLSASHYFKQDKVAALETNTNGYTMVDANFNYYIDGIGDDLVIFAKANNITNEEARVHASFLKDVSPLPARGFELGIRGSF
ncbi:TonB-dependent receptor [Thalassotalea sp. G2M2-11]|uniref:TonB-dependent receptor n=1 Tax=Thalassotalea sp. G2M2-11 TaxID=2787627 RepID=UPI0019D21032|nr:TonB-dependent receptor [Thalassotalea sp. G2M2-11]